MNDDSNSLSPWTEAFADDGSGHWRTNWFLDGDTATVDNTPAGMILRAGPDVSDNGDSMVLWTRKAFVGDVKIEYEFTRLDRAVEGVNIIYLKATGTGEAPYEKDILVWASVRHRARMPLYFNHMNALHISYSVDLPGSDDEYIRARRYPAPVGVPFQKATEIEGTFWNTGLFKPEVPYEITVVSEGASLLFVVRGDGREARFEWNVSAFPLLSEGRIGLRLMPTRVSRIRNFRVSVSTGK
jgi:hypothetical protein